MGGAGATSVRPGSSSVFGAKIAMGASPRSLGSGEEGWNWTMKCQLGAEQFVGAEVQATVAEQLPTGVHACFDIIAKPWGIPGYVFVQYCPAREEVPKGDVPKGAVPKEAVSKEAVSNLLLTTRCAMFVMEYHDRYTLEDVVLHKEQQRP